MPDPIFTREAKQYMLEQVLRSATVGLTRRGKEIDDPGYRPQNVTWEAQSGDNDVEERLNGADITFGPWAKLSPGPITGWIVRGAEGIDLPNVLTIPSLLPPVVAQGTFIESQNPPVNGEVLIHPGKIVLGLK